MSNLNDYKKAAQEIATHNTGIDKELEDLLDILDGPRGWRADIEGLITQRTEQALKAQRKSDLKKLSFMFGIPVEDLEKALQSKERL